VSTTRISTTTTAHLDENTGTYAYTVPATFTISESLITAILSDDGTGYWAERGTYSNGIATWWEREAHRYNDDGTQTRKHSATFEAIADALVTVALGRANVRDEYATEAATMIANANAGDIITEPETCDIIIQTAMFGDVIYG